MTQNAGLESLKSVKAESDLEPLKKAHDYFATAVQTLTTRVQYFHEEFQGINNTITFLSTLRDDAKKRIEELEPTKKEETKAFNMDLSHIKPESSEVTADFK